MLNDSGEGHELTRAQERDSLRIFSHWGLLGGTHCRWAHICRLSGVGICDLASNIGPKIGQYVIGLLSEAVSSVGSFAILRKRIGSTGHNRPWAHVGCRCVL